MKLIIFGGLLLLLMWLLRRFVAPNAQRHVPPRTRTAQMSRAEALAVLGLHEPASPDEIIDAHRKLMQHLHPDKGGSAHLAQQLNEAKRVLLAK